MLHRRVKIEKHHFRRKHCIGNRSDIYGFIKPSAQVRVPGDGTAVEIWSANVESDIDGTGGEPQLERELNLATAGVSRRRGQTDPF